MRTPSRPKAVSARVRPSLVFAPLAAYMRSASRRVLLPRGTCLVCGDFSRSSIHFECFAYGLYRHDLWMVIVSLRIAPEWVKAVQKALFHRNLQDKFVGK